MTTDELNGLENFLQQDIPFVPERVKTFFDIGGFAHKEVIISRFYAYYFDPNESHGFGNLFLSSLLSILSEEKARQRKLPNTLIPEIRSFSVCSVDREVYTIDKKYIDILIEGSENNSENPDATIVIENKIFYRGHNPWEDYINHSRSTHCTIGVILSFTYDNREKCHDKFVNIKHSSLLREIEQNLGKYFISVDLQKAALLKEFIQTMQNMESSRSTEAEYSFLINNNEKIKKINNLTKLVNSNTIDQLNEVCNKFNELYKSKLSYKKGNVFNDSSSSREYIFFRDKTENLSLSVGFYNVNTIYVHIHLINLSESLVEKMINIKYKGVQIGKDLVNKPWRLYAKLEFQLIEGNYTNSWNYIFIQIEER